VASIIERIDLDSGSNLMWVRVGLTASLRLTLSDHLGIN
jgi:hypothetical protein